MMCEENTGKLYMNKQQVLHTQILPEIMIIFHKLTTSVNLFHRWVQIRVSVKE